MAKLLGWKELPLGGIIPKGGTSVKYKTGGWRTYKPLHNMELCTHCLRCWISCPDTAIVAEEGKFVRFDYDYCKGCGVCASICPVKPEKAIKMQLESEE